MLRDRIAKRYAKSLFELALEQNLVDDVRADMADLSRLIRQSRDLELLLASPVVRQHVKQKAFKAVFDGKLHKLTSLFIDQLMKHGREELIPDVTHEFLDLYNRHQNITRVVVESAQPLTDDTRAKISALVAQQLNTTPLLEEYLDDRLIGGFVLKIGTQQYDASLQNSLRKVRQSLLEA
jgi:F-type H+-transporting ATPase subunit delta